MPALSALSQGFEVYVVTDACGGVSRHAHEHAVQRVIQAGASPLTWLTVLLELQRDWARTETYEDVLGVVKAHGGAYGQGVTYAQRFIGESAAG
jgi:nicotinamidase-related amidase